jgi:arsenate reductase-like glutaredoxin family protein
MLDQNMIDDLKANAEKLLNTAQALYNKSQELTANLSDKDTAQIIVAIEGYLELVGVGKKDTNNSRKIIVQELNVNAGMMG